MKNKILHAAYFTPVSRGWGLPILLWSAPGTAKTSTMRQLASSYNVPCEVLSPGERGEGAFGVVPVPQNTAGGMVLAYPAPAWAIDMGEAGLVLADELTTAPPAIQPAILGLSLDGRIGGYTLPKRVRVFAASNDVECSAAGYELPAPSANRFCHVKWSIDVSAVTDFFINGVSDSEKIDDIAEENRVLAAWPEARAKAAGIISAFLTRHPDLLHKMPQEGDPQRGKAWPSPRSWELALRALASASIHGLDEQETDTLCAGCVGESAWREFRDYQASLDLPDPALLLDGAITWAPDNRRLDKTAAVITSCVALVMPKDAAMRKERALKLWELLDTVGKAGARDITIAACQSLVRAALGFASPVAQRLLADMKLAGFSDAMRK